MAVMFRSVLQSSGGAAELVVACADEFAGATISCSDGTTTLTKTCPSSSPYTVTFKIPNSGNWTISATVSGVTYTSDPISVVLDYTALLPFGFSWQTWVDTAQYLDSTDYSTLSDLLADEEAVRELCTEHACVDYLCQSADVNPDLATVINNDIFAKWVNLRDYSLDKMYANAAIADEMEEADKYGYGEWALVGQVPKMTSNTAPYGTVSASGTGISGHDLYIAFDGDASTYTRIDNPGQTPYLQYTFVNPVIVKRCAFSLGINASFNVEATYTLQGSNDGFVSDINDLGSVTVFQGDSVIDSTNNTAYSAYRLKASNPNWKTSTSSTTATSFLVVEIQFYAWAPKGNVPIMTSNSAPYGTASANGADSGKEAYKAFDGDSSTYWYYSSSSASGHYLTYKFSNPVNAKKCKLIYARPSSTVTSYNFQIQGSNDGTQYTPISETIAVTNLPSGRSFLEIDIDTSDTYYMYYKLVISGQSLAPIVYALQFYGRELSVSVPKMDGNNSPYGEASASTFAPGITGNYAWKSFDTLQNTGWFPNSTDSTPWIQYDFKKKVIVKQAYLDIWSYGYTSSTMSGISIEASNDGFDEDIHVLASGISVSGLATTASYAHSIARVSLQDNETEYRYYRFKFSTVLWRNQSSWASACIVQFWGKEYSEKEFEENTTKKWLYDHGVELETLDSNYTDSSSSLTIVAPTKENSQIYGVCNNNYPVIGTSQAIDLTDYSLLRVNGGDKGNLLNSAFAVMSVSTSKNIASPTATLTINTMPYGMGLDVTSFNSDNYISVRMAGPNGRAYSFKELWLE